MVTGMDRATAQLARQLDDLEDRLNPSSRRRQFKRLMRLSWRISQSLGRLAKRGLDIIGAGSLLLLASPVMILAAVLIKACDGGPVFFWQTRVGKWGRPFAFPKFRSMRVDAEAVRQQLAAANQHGDGITFKMKHDPRITWIGRWMRRMSIDELPQLWCVLKGDMSLVGPRPALVGEVARYGQDDRRRLDATPGLTCIWQVSGRSDIPFPEQLRLDVEYIRDQSLATDIRLLLRTIPAVITGRGAY